MNSLIKELAEEAGYLPDMFGRGHWDMPECKKFAELIVRETVKEMSQQLYWHRMEQSNNPAYYKAIKKTLEHFGVE